jgi:hypothetical protein
LSRNISVNTLHEGGDDDDEDDNDDDDNNNNNNNNKHNRRTYMPSAGFEHAIPAIEQSRPTH